MFLGAIPVKLLPVRRFFITGDTTQKPVPGSSAGKRTRGSRMQYRGLSELDHSLFMRGLEPGLKHRDLAA